jgi:multiple sugar transport system ATP-binding protein
MNVFDAAITRDDQVRFSVAGGPTLVFPETALPQGVRDAIGRRDNVVIGARPHAVRLGAGPHSARIVSNQWLGDQSHLALDVAGKLLVAVSHAPVAARPGDTVAYDLRLADLHIFDVESGAALSHGLEAAR